ncbi:hypothetical protein BGZ65_003223 [Modicella reniformis]|uniref:Uncharacterized protein n=1 Tax=Modicella reniformis TaxID=1440133 RepID=A0A9P6J7B4_9FUNG|nr:hypothetical protein BGZ65_003223 [Modicella reniformis]
MASGFFHSIPSSILVREPYEEVFSLFTTETAETPWAHNRSVSQQASQLELELDFTPISSPVASQPGSRPNSRSGSYFPAIVSTVAVANIESSRSGSRKGLVSGLGISGAGLMEDDLSSTSPSISPPPTSTSPVLGLGRNNSNGSTIHTNASSPKVKSSAVRALLGSRRSSRTNTSTSPGSVKAASPQPTNRKPVVIHQSLSTLSQPGQTGTVVWDSSILMAKFLLSIKELTIGCYRHHVKEQRAQRIKDRRVKTVQQQRIRKLEEQAERLTVSSKGDLRAKAAPEEVSSVDQQEKHAAGQDTYRSDDEDDGDDIDTIDDRDGDGTDNGEDMLVFDPAETTILELGSGCGLLGIVMAELCQKLLLTDQKSVLPLLVKNLRKNLDMKHFDQNSASATFTAASESIVLTSTPSTSAGISSSVTRGRKGRGDSASSASSVKPCHVQVQELVWNQDLDQDLKHGIGMDYIIATDVVYNESVVPNLVHTLKELCEIRECVRREYTQGHGEHLDRLQEILSAGYSGRGVGESQEDEEVLRLRRLRRMRRMLNRTVVLLAQELRTDYVHLAFLEGLKQAGFRMVRMPKQMMDPDYHSGYVIYACFL